MKNSNFLCFLLVVLSFQNVTPQSTRKTNILWVDPLKNIRTITTRSQIAGLMSKASSSGFQGVALGIKTTTGQVIFESDIAPRLLEWNGQTIPKDFDIVKEFSEQAIQSDLIFYAVYPVFAGGNMIERKGLLYDEHVDWQSYVYVVEKEEPEIIPITQWAFGSIAYENPLNATVQNYEISVINEFLDEYTVGGFIFDKLRFYGIEADFSNETKNAFEGFLGSKIDWWPRDVFEWQLQDERWEIVPGDRFLDWVNFRAQSSKNIAAKLVQAVRRNAPSLQVGNFVGSWYPTYYEYGVNWASESHHPDENWAPSDYNKTSIAETFDYMVTGSFYPRVAMEDAEADNAEWWMSVEGGAELAKNVINDATPIYGALLVEQFKDDREKFKLALKTALEKTDGLFLTDLSHIQKNNYWGAIAAVFLGKADNQKRR